MEVVKSKLLLVVLIQIFFEVIFIMLLSQDEHIGRKIRKPCDLIRRPTSKNYKWCQRKGRNKLCVSKASSHFYGSLYEVHPCGTHELIKQLKVLENQKSVVYLFKIILFGTFFTSKFIATFSKTSEYPTTIITK